MIRRFIVRFLLGAGGTWIAASFVPSVSADNLWSTYLLMGLFIAVGEIALDVLDPVLSIILFLLPKSLRILALRIIVVAVAAGLVSGFAFTPPIAVGLLGTTFLLSLLFFLPLAS